MCHVCLILVVYLKLLGNLHLNVLIGQRETKAIALCIILNIARESLMR